MLKLCKSSRKSRRKLSRKLSRKSSRKSRRKTRRKTSRKSRRKTSCKLRRKSTRKTSCKLRRKSTRKSRRKYDGVKKEMLLLSTSILSLLTSVSAAGYPYLSGPTRLDMYKNEDNGNVIIFLGDVHFESEGLCPSHNDFSIPKFLEDLGEISKKVDSEKPVQFFVEASIESNNLSFKEAIKLYKKNIKNKERKDEPLFQLKFGKLPCYNTGSKELTWYKKNCINNVEMVGIDPRITLRDDIPGDFTKYDLGLSTIRDILSALQYGNINKEQAKHILSKFFKEISAIKDIIFSKNYFDDLPEDTYLKSLIKSIESDEIRNICIDICRKYFTYIYKNHIKRLKTIGLTINLKDYEKTLTVEDWMEDVLYSYLFRLEESQVELIGIILAILKDSPISVFYLGENHTTEHAEYLMTKILKDYFKFTKIKTIINTEPYKRCMEIEEIYNDIPGYEESSKEL